MRERKACLACLENGRTPDAHGGDCADYLAQVRWNRTMARLLATEPDREAVPAVPDYSTPEAVSARCREQGTLDPVGRGIYALLASDGRAYRLHRKACAQGAQIAHLVTQDVTCKAPKKAHSRARTADRAA